MKVGLLGLAHWALESNSVLLLLTSRGFNMVVAFGKTVGHAQKRRFRKWGK